ncbi:uncharacterized protein Z520_05940 [Fonsecaea multimorphosa CBS 102226]|uniref:FAD-containing monooxygenase EthA n=1 Tax=Fonsecaea multimorphosa CBS 102226 TaxID=1442371 RepID=A0A0D2K628_9EURO|nr:uncharacterized protein Z520_05940 [Fonsecaea multimorphosa CBS 102226]KIX98639.1 hypothetical protein Z520_05940 [Fonsecaea multimorphosa CBS 102226]
MIPLSQSKLQDVDYDVIIVGAGISGIGLASRLQVRNPDLSYCILESRHEVGGTWSLFQYPGIRSDSDLYTFGYSWRPWNERSAIAHGSKIAQYLKECAAQEGIDQKIKFHHRVTRAEWSTEAKKWTLDLTDGESARGKTLSARFLFFGTGYYDYHRGRNANIPGLSDFQGTVVHPQFWPRDLDYADKNIVIIGSGATAVTLLPAVSEKASHVTMLQRSPSYIVSIPREDAIERAIRLACPRGLAAKLIRFKWILLPLLQVRYCQWFPRVARRMLRSMTKKELPVGMSLDPNFDPKYWPWEQRLCMCPDGDFYEALRSGKGSVKTGVIDTVTKIGIRLKSGEELAPDIIVTATGLKMQAAGGVKFIVDGQDFRISEHYMWRAAMLDGLPNAILSFGYVDASWTLGLEATAELACRLLRKMQKDKFSMIVPRYESNEKTRLREEGFMKLNSTYVQEGNADMPRFAAQSVWRRRSYYWRDIFSARWGSIKTGLEWSMEV